MYYSCLYYKLTRKTTEFDYIIAEVGKYYFEYNKKFPKSTKMSHFDKEIVNMLQIQAESSNLPVKYINEVPIDPHKILYVDLLVNDKVIVEIDGPTHFHENGKYRKGEDYFREKLIKSLGYQFIRINYSEYNQRNLHERGKLVSEILNI